MGSISLADFKSELGIDPAFTSDDAVLQRKLDAAVEKFELSTGRQITVPTPDVDQTITRPVIGGVLRLPDARSITSITSTVAGSSPYDLSTVLTRGWKSDATLIWAVLPSTDETRYPDRVTVVGKFGMTNIPATIVDGVYALAAHKWRSRGSEAAGQYETVDGEVQMVFDRVSPAYASAVKDWRVPVTSGLTTMKVNGGKLEEVLPEWFPYASF